MSFEMKFHDKNGLCGGCKWSFIRKTPTNTSIICTYFTEHITIKEPVVECNQYENINHPTKREFELLAWTISTNEKNVVGFQPPKKKDYSYERD